MSRVPWIRSMGDSFAIPVLLPVWLGEYPGSPRLSRRANCGRREPAWQPPCTKHATYSASRCFSLPEPQSFRHTVEPEGMNVGVAQHQHAVEADFRGIWRVD